MFKFRITVFSAVFAIITLIGFGTWSFRHLEDWTWAESFYFSVATLTTVGYGDIHPTSDTSRIFTSLYILVGVGVVLAALSNIGSRYLDTQEHELSNSITRRIGRIKMRSRKRKSRSGRKS